MRYPDGNLCCLRAPSTELSNSHEPRARTNVWSLADWLPTSSQSRYSVASFRHRKSPNLRPLLTIAFLRCGCPYPTKFAGSWLSLRFKRPWVFPCSGLLRLSFAMISTRLRREGSMQHVGFPYFSLQTLLKFLANHLPWETHLSDRCYWDQSSAPRKLYLTRWGCSSVACPACNFQSSQKWTCCQLCSAESLTGWCRVTVQSLATLFSWARLHQGLSFLHFSYELNSSGKQLSYFCHSLH